jgi:nucleoside-diphosphate-sugar epimerase
MRAVVTGCAGFIGSHLCERILASGGSVVGIDALAPTYDSVGRRNRVAEMASNRGFEFIGGDINEIDLRPFFLDANVVFHLAARPGVRASWSDFRRASDANILATQRVLDALSSVPPARLVFASSSSVYGQADSFPTTEDQALSPISPYGVTKASCEALISAYVSQFELDVVSLRYFTVYGPRQRSDMAFTRWISAALAGHPLPLYGDGTAVRDFTYVSDVVDATIAAASVSDPGHMVFNVAGGSPASLLEVFDVIARTTARDLEFNRMPAAQGDPSRTGGDTSRIRNDLGWTPTWSLEDGIRSQVDWLLSRG